MRILEIEYEGIRYVFRRNPQRAEEVSANRSDKLKNLLKDFWIRKTSTLPGMAGPKRRLPSIKWWHSPEVEVAGLDRSRCQRKAIDASV